MPKKRFWFYLVLALLWTGLIFSRSLQPAAQSTQESQSVLSFVSGFLPFAVSEFFIRKCAHFAEFAVLGLLWGLAFVQLGPGRWKTMPYALLTGVLTALGDETIQLFVEGRTGKLPDVWLDFAGVFTGALLVSLARGTRRKRRG